MSIAISWRLVGCKMLLILNNLKYVESKLKMFSFCIFSAAKMYTNHCVDTPFGLKNILGQPPSSTRNFCWNIVENVEFKVVFRHLVISRPHCHILTSFFRFPTEILKGNLKMYLICIQAVKGAEKFQITKC